MKKLIASITLFTFFTCYPAFAFVPIAIPAVAIGAGALVGAAINLAGLYFFMKPGSSGSVNASGVIKRPSGAVWVDLKDFNLNEKNITASMSHSKAVELANKKDSSGNYKFPTVRSALIGSTAEPMSPSSVVGTIYSTNVGFGRVTATRGPVTNTGQSTQNCTTRWTSSYVIFPGASTGGGFCTEGAKITFTSASAPPEQEYTVPRSNQNLTGLGPAGANGGDVASNYQTELDKMFQDPDYIPTFTDDTTGLPFSPPPVGSVASPSQVAAYNAKGAANEAIQQASASSGSAASAASNAATTAAAAYAASGGDPATGIGGDQSLYQKMKDAEASAAAAQAADDKLKADLAADEAESLKVTENVQEGDLSGASGLGSVITYRLKSLGSNIAGRAPISYLSGVKDAISSLYAPAVAPSFDLPLGPFASEPLHISMAWADPLAVLTRFFSWLTFALGAIWSFKGYWHRS